MDGRTVLWALFCTYFQDWNYCKSLIACSPLLKQYNFGEIQHFEPIVESLSDRDSELCDVKCIVGYICKVSLILAKICFVVLIGFNWHMLNLSVEQWIFIFIGSPEATEVIRELMSQLKTLSNATRLREKLHLEALLRNGSYWTKNVTRSSDTLKLKNSVSLLLNSTNIFPHL